MLGNIPGGLPGLHVPGFNLRIILQLLPMAAVIALMGFMETITVAKIIAARTGNTVKPNQELVSQGLANMFGFFTSSYAVSGSFARSALNYQAGSRTGLSNIFCSLVVLCVMIFLTKYFYYLPRAVLAAIIMMAVANLVDLKEFLHAWRASKHDGIVFIVTFVATLIFAPHLDTGILIGVGLSLGFRVFSEMHPDIHLLSKHHDGSFRPADIHNFKPCRHIAVVKFNDSLFYENVSFLEESIIKIISLMPELKHIVIASKGINELDASGEEMLCTLVPGVREMGYEISFSGVNEEVSQVMKRTGLYKLIGAENFYNSVQETVYSIHEKTHTDSDEVACPLLVPVAAGEADMKLINFSRNTLFQWMQKKTK